MQQTNERKLTNIESQQNTRRRVMVSEQEQLELVYCKMQILRWRNSSHIVLSEEYQALEQKRDGLLLSIEQQAERKQAHIDE